MSICLWKAMFESFLFVLDFVIAGRREAVYTVHCTVYIYVHCYTITVFCWIDVGPFLSNIPPFLSHRTWLCRDWWQSPVTLLQEVKNCGMAEGCSVKASTELAEEFLWPHWGRPSRGRQRRTSRSNKEKNGSAQSAAFCNLRQPSSSPGQHSQTQFSITYCNKYVKNPNKNIYIKKTWL